MVEVSADRPKPSRLRRSVRWALGVLAVGLLLGSLWQQRAGVADALARIDLSVVLLSSALALVALVASMMAWRALLTAAGHRLGVPTAARLYFLTQISKYLPGSIWPVVAQMELGREQGVSVAASGIAAVLNLLIGIGTGVVVGLAALVVSGGSASDYWWLAFCLPVLLVVLRPAVVRKALTIVLRLTRRPVQNIELQGRGMAAAAGWSSVMWLFFGLHVYVVADAVGDPGVARSVGAYALAWVAGFLVFFAPAGAGARELSLVLLLSPPLGRSEALAVAVISRVVGIVADAIVALAGVAAGRRRPRGRVEDSA